MMNGMMNVSMFAFAIFTHQDWCVVLRVRILKKERKKNHRNLITSNNELPLAKTPEIVSEQKIFPTCSGDLSHSLTIYISEKVFI